MTFFSRCNLKGRLHVLHCSMFFQSAHRPIGPNITFLLALLLAWSGCQEPPEEFSFPEWTPIVAVPLVDTRFDLGDVLEVLTDNLDSLPVVAMPNGQLVFVQEEVFSGTLAEEWLVLPSVLEEEEFVLDAVTAAALNVLPPGEVLTYSDTLQTSMVVGQPEAAVLMEIELATGQLEFTLTSDVGDDVGGELWLPNLVDNTGIPWSVEWTPEMLETGLFSVTEDLAGWKILPDNTGDALNEISGAYTLFLQSSPNHTALPGESLTVALTMDQLTFERVEGDFGEDEISLEESTTTFALFDDRFTTAGIELEQASIELVITNGFGVNASLQEVDFESVSAGVVLASLETSEPSLFVGQADGSSQSPTVSSWLVDETNSNLVDLFSADPVDWNLSLSIVANPGGLAEGEVNFVDADGFVDAEFRAEVPLSIRASQVDFVDTLDFSLSVEEQAELDSAELRLILNNGFPFGVDLQAYFLDEDGVVLDSLMTSSLSLFTMPSLTSEGVPLAPAEFRQDFFFDWERSNRLKLADRVVVQAWCATADANLGAFVRLTENQDLWMQLGALLYTRIEL